MKELQTEKQKYINDYLKTVTLINKYFDIDYENLDKITKKYLRFTVACKSKNCDKIDELPDIDSISACMANCQFSYDYKRNNRPIPFP